MSDALRCDYVEFSEAFASPILACPRPAERFYVLNRVPGPGWPSPIHLRRCQLHPYESSAGGWRVQAMDLAEYLAYLVHAS